MEHIDGFVTDADLKQYTRSMMGKSFVTICNTAFESFECAIILAEIMNSILMNNTKLNICLETCENSDYLYDFFNALEPTKFTKISIYDQTLKIPGMTQLISKFMPTITSLYFHVDSKSSQEIVQLIHQTKTLTSYTQMDTENSVTDEILQALFLQAPTLNTLALALMSKTTTDSLASWLPSSNLTNLRLNLPHSRH